MPTMPSYKDLPLWQRAMRQVVEIYQLTATLPATERLGLSSSLQQSAIAVPTLLAAGSKQGRAGFVEACLAARRSAAEVETLLSIVQQVYPDQPVDDLLAEAADLQTGLTLLARRLSKQPEKKV